MKNKSEAFACILVLIVASLTSEVSRAAVVTYTGTGTGCVGHGSLTWDDSGGILSGSFVRGDGAPFTDDLVIYIDSISGGINTTSGLRDAGDRFRKAVTGYNGSSKCTLNFASGFNADYAILLHPGAPSGGKLYALPTQGGVLTEIDSALHLSSSTDWTRDNQAKYDFWLSPASLGITGSVTFGFETDYAVDYYGATTKETLEHITGTAGWGGTLVFSDYHQFPQVNPIPEPTNVALAAFGFIAITTGFARSIFRRTRA